MVINKTNITQPFQNSMVKKTESKYDDEELFSEDRFCPDGNLRKDEPCLSLKDRFNGAIDGSVLGTVLGMAADVSLLGAPALIPAAVAAIAGGPVILAAVIGGLAPLAIFGTGFAVQGFLSPSSVRT